MTETTIITKGMIEQTTQTLSNLCVPDDEPTSWVDEHPEQAAALVEMCGLIGGLAETALSKYLDRNHLSRIEFDLAGPDGERFAFGHQTAGEPGLFQVA